MRLTWALLRALAWWSPRRPRAVTPKSKSATVAKAETRRFQVGQAGMSWGWVQAGGAERTDRRGLSVRFGGILALDNELCKMTNYGRLRREVEAGTRGVCAPRTDGKFRSRPEG